jgi:hypothetical protein
MRTSNCFRANVLRLLTVSTAIIALALAFSPQQARADGDPASDVLALQPLFMPQDARAPASQQAELGALIRAAGRSGYQIRVAVIASPTDLGSVTELWGQPETYAEFLGQELSLLYRGPLLVIMPAGLGVYDTGRTLAAEQSALAGIRTSSAGAALATAAATAIQRLAAASGHTFAVPSATVPSFSGSTDVVAWIVFVLGAALVVVAWTASLRARPVQLRGKSKPSV